MSESDRYGVTYPVPLEDGFIAELRLPVNLSRAEADKIARVIATLALAPAPAEASHVTTTVKQFMTDRSRGFDQLLKRHAPVEEERDG